MTVSNSPQYAKAVCDPAETVYYTLERDSSTLVVEVKPEKFEFENSSEHITFLVNRTYLVGHNEVCFLGSIEPLKSKYEKIRIIIDKEDGEQVEVTDKLTETCRNAFLKFLMEGRPCENYGCIDFYESTLGQYNEKTNNILQGNWNITSLNEKTLAPGDGIIIFKIVKTAEQHLSLQTFGQDPHGILGKVLGIGLKMTHWATCLDSNLFLSLTGHMGPPIIASLEEMKKGFGGDFTCKVIEHTVNDPE